ncbi:photosystem reaction center subunit H [Streptomyces qaidamensis]|uniref:Photosystem reaction center subunit H n=1 Tax=Streptomyces qaidamensis TaxID=1783515 RepID=A0A143BTZ8_9ACTN|nr:YsnF/AvaK domain-containing protein [Streptomyces qaidamensis]AMW08360.1 photosystem reaction center subunit H [Streptomyces qaidamensis]
MITREQIDTVLDHPVHDARGDKIGDARHVFFDDVTGEPEWVSVRTGLFGTSESFVPIHDAALVEDHLEVPYAKDQVKDAPNVDIDAGGHLSEQEEQRLYQYYGIDWDASWQDPHSGTGQATGTTGTTGTTGDEAMTRSEEEMHVGVERREAGRARLRKYVVTEEQQYTVPVRHEEVRVEREPITDANRDRAMTGPDITEAEHDVTLYEEQPVVETRAVPKERVRMTTEEVTEEETVTGEVRKERIETEGTEGTEGTDEHGDQRRRR